jgi:glutamate synthase (NADPH/NADH) large chain
LKQYINNHAKYTGSKVATRILDNWYDEIKHFIKIMPKDFKRVLTKNTST